MPATSLKALLPTLLGDLPPSTPYTVHIPLLGAVLSRLNEPDAITALFDYAVDHFDPTADVDEPHWATVVQNDWNHMDGRNKGALVLAVRTREALLKSFSLIGFPLTISSLTTFSSHLASQHVGIWPAVQKIEGLQPFPTAFEPFDLHEPKAASTSEEPSRGRRLFNSIYGKVAGRVVESLRWGHPNLVDSALKLIYTPVLSDVRILTDPLDSSLLCLVLCFSSDLPPQTKGHFRGAINLGAKRPLLEPLLKAVWALVDWAPAGRLRVERMDFLKEVGVEAGALSPLIDGAGADRSKI